ncbi:phosphopantetheine-binding protein, partial [Streptomyces griseochromogenes]|uniref:phosphopantetheine-binding protein n=1 Tax=Streptomyces griseochromogenes TaxID=68214 RepID=UPI0037B5D840
EVLGIDQIGIHDNFFDLGGHSLLATRVVNRVESLTSLEISLREFFLAPTVASLTEKLVELVAGVGADDPTDDGAAEER